MAKRAAKTVDFVPDLKPVDRGETVDEMEPLLIAEGSPVRPALMDTAMTLVARSAGFRKSLPDGIARSLADLVRSMNCYYSNLIEGHNTHPVDIERALKGEYSHDKKKRDLQLEAKAHISVQKWIDEGGVSGRVATRETICEIHRRFCSELPDDLLIVEDPVTHERIPVEPGELRARDVKVGNLVPVSPGAIPRFLDRFEQVYEPLGKSESILAAATAHHRLAWIHPFLDGNGRVCRLMSHAMFLETLDTGALWSVARGLARKVEDYKQLLANCDLTRRNDLDGRGNLSEEALIAFTRFFLEISIDQVDFMERLVEPEQLRTRILNWTREQMSKRALPPQADKIMEATLYRGGKLLRGEAAEVTGTGDRHARRAVAGLVSEGVLASEGPTAPVYLAFPARLASIWMPGLFPANEER
jgi:Fic family protein